MGSDKIKIKDIEGTQDEVLGFFKNSGLDIGDYLNSAKSIKIPLCTIICASIVFLLSICIASCIDNGKAQTVLTIIALAAAFTNLGFIYMAWKNKTLTGIIALGETFIFAIALHVYTPKDVVHKVEDKIEKLQ
ncbi:hypothetical protein [Bacteroides pyogenes]|uniref:hypothetical protein n=1 Tax=Bacteroides pyogenes TaxID=310300 RepID=UPI002FD9F652